MGEEAGRKGGGGGREMCVHMWMANDQDAEFRGIIVCNMKMTHRIDVDEAGWTGRVSKGF